MKVGTLIRALSLLLVLPSTTVLSLTGGIDRTMKAGLALFLLGSMNTVMATDKTPVEDCAKHNPFMHCIATKGCTNGGTSEVMTFFAEETITSDCKAILKIRPYSHKMYRVVLESRDPTATEITLTREGEITPLFSCKVGLSQYKGNQMTLLNAQGSLLKCEFIAADANSDIMSNTAPKLILSVNGNEFWRERENLIQPALEPNEYCNPVDASFDNADSVGLKVEKFVIGLTDLSCRPPFQLETRMRITSHGESKMEPQFVKTTAIKCTLAKWTVEREGVASVQVEKGKTFSYRCTSKTCTLCDYLPKAVENITDITDGTDGCKELKCKQSRMKVGDTLGDKAICTNNDDKPVWSLGKTPIEASTTVECMEKLKCDTTSICDEDSDDHCVLVQSQDQAENIVPSCSGGRYLTYQSERVTVDCDGNTGKWMYNDGSRPPAELPAGKSLSCLSDSEISRKEDPAAASTATIAYVAGGIAGFIVIAVLVGFGIYWYMKKKRAAKIGKTGKSVETPNPKSQSKSVNSKESKKEGEAAPASALPPEFTSRAPTIVMPAYIKTKYGDISSTTDGDDAEDKKKRKEKKKKKKELKRLMREKEAVEEELMQVEKEREKARKEKKNKVYEPEDFVDDKDDGFGPTQEAPEVTQPTQVTGGTGQAAVAATQDTTTAKKK